MSKSAKAGINAQKVGVNEKLKGGEILGENGGACVTMQGTFQRVCVNTCKRLHVK